MMGQFDDMIAKIRLADPQPIPPEMADLESMIALARQHAERVLIGEPKETELMPAWAILTKTGQSLIVSTPFFDEQSKDMIAIAMRQLMADVGAVRYSMASEAWLASGKTPDRRPPAQRDDRLEVVMIIACEAGISKMSTFELIRDWQTGSVTELRLMAGEVEVAGGRFAGLLEDM